MERRKRIFMNEESELKTNVSSNEKSIIDNDNESINSIGHSGNSDVDLKVDVNIDTTAIGFAILCSLFATRQMDNEEFQIAVQKLEGLTNKKMSTFTGRDVNSPNNIRLFNPKKR
ncbi:hypothetical protein JMM81_10710 [Bacillus sp. V3B]|uniref:hypothetical protein n=1 Tax=Bacillus sp. V3B TaxID=2804915 RepID=UPI00210C697D|nr:hypothetical protein [Bacillus sp. V3B]MCQ6275430.1 hypothetical protein [Bacillus sp. V3B]